MLIEVMNKPELLLPVGNMEMCLAAIHNGADAIYLGSPYFNARGRSKDHSLEEVKEMIDICHLYGLKVHIAFNILIFQDELQSAFEALRNLIKLSPDALIIQDIGLVQMVRMLSPNQEIHGSTQMSITNYEAIELLNDLDIARFVLGRENTISDIKSIKENTKKEIEVFVHGALCVAYSGQCFTSESLGGRSANRGQCAQSCRFEYELIVDGETKDLDGKKYLVSPQDLCGIDQIPLLAQIGVDSLKVEGRLKSKEYVAVAARSYKSVIDDNSISTVNLKKQMSTTFSRGLYPGWLNGVAHQELVGGEYQDHRGLLVGRVKTFLQNKLIIESKTDLKIGDGLLFVNGSNKIGSKIIFSKQISNNEYEIRLLDKTEILKNSEIYLNSDEVLINEVAKSIKDDNLLKKISIDITLTALIGEKLKATFSDNKNIVTAQSDFIVEEAQSRGMSLTKVKEEITKLSRTVYSANKVNIKRSEGDLFINLKEVKKLKNQLVELLNNKRIESFTSLKDSAVLDLRPIETKKESKKVNLLIRNFEQLNRLIDLKTNNSEILKNLDYLILDYEFGKDYVNSVKLCKENDLIVFIATTRILKPNEYHNFKLIERANPDGLLIRNLGALSYFSDKDFILIGDFSLNVTNSLTFDYLAKKGLKSICLSYDLNKEQLDSLLKHVDCSLAEVTVFQYMPEFHMEHCVFAAFMSKGNSFRDCGKPCEKHEVALKDMYGNIHEIKADQECRNTMFNGVAQSSLGLVSGWESLGVRSFRIEVLHETGTVFDNKIINLFKFFNDEISKSDVIIDLNINEKYGISSGQLLAKDDYKDQKIHD